MLSLDLSNRFLMEMTVKILEGVVGLSRPSHIQHSVLILDSWRMVSSEDRVGVWVMNGVIEIKKSGSSE